MTDLSFPGGKRFAFTIMDDTDVSTVENVGPVYRLLDSLGFRTTKTVWPFGYREGPSDFAGSETLEEPEHVEFVRWLESRGFEIAYHGATMESSTRERTEQGLRRFRELFGASPKVYANHANNREGLYWGVDRIDSAPLRILYVPLSGRPRDHYQGHREDSPFWWGDLAEGFRYVRNLTCRGINTLRFNPSMPYHDATRPLVQRWFSASDADNVEEFNALIAPEAQDALEREGGVCIVATHLGKGYARGGAVDPRARELLERLSRRPGWFVPVGELLDWLASQRGGRSDLPAGEWRRMQWEWAFELVAQRFRPRRWPPPAQ